jgi:osmoprotectant transport system permease protein
MGYTARRQLLEVELPLAVPAIVAGIRIATVTTIGLVTVTALIGQGGLGQLILQGFTRDFRTPLVIGLAGSAALAVVADFALLAVERVATPWSRSSARMELTS